MPEHDHRTFSIPLFVLGAALAAAGLVALLASSIIDTGPSNAAGAIGAGVLLLFGSIAVTVLLNPASDLGARPARSVPIAAGSVLIALVLAVIAGAAIAPDALPQSASGATADVGSANVPEATAALGTEEFTGTLQGAATGTPVGDLGRQGTTSVVHELSPEPMGRALRAEVHWSPAAPGGPTELSLRLENAQGEILASATGTPGFTLDATGLPSGGLRLVVSLPDGTVSPPQDYAVYSSYFTAEIPAGFSAAPDGP